MTGGLGMILASTTERFNPRGNLPIPLLAEGLGMHRKYRQFV